eukprot:CAMPEP_0116858484 /NCGR_PEP_ID=MMETSP0418-20121206/21207_1 /TAXON_ID=1158023 /ORGANISM="Astrosyne radiata, Strain 13vi08-1A" /LENGTH=222 /DNA_ID=CAMNT_0004492429 /DNA_START=1866 /DNA_END=2530 /DNA_ORIENTATION=+
MKGGIQKKCNKNPGVAFASTIRTAYLVDNDVGQEVRLKCALKEGIVLLIGTSQTTGRKNVIVWSSIPHKSTLSGGEFGYPDPLYADICHIELTQLGVPDASNLDTTSLVPSMMAPLTDAGLDRTLLKKKLKYLHKDLASNTKGTAKIMLKLAETEPRVVQKFMECQKRFEDDGRLSEVTVVYHYTKPPTWEAFASTDFYHSGNDRGSRSKQLGQVVQLLVMA